MYFGQSRFTSMEISKFPRELVELDLLPWNLVEVDLLPCKLVEASMEIHWNFPLSVEVEASITSINCFHEYIPWKRP